MEKSFRHLFTSKAKPSKNVYNVLVMGAGKMGERHIASLLDVSEKVLKPKFGVFLKVYAVDKKENVLLNLPPEVETFLRLEDALHEVKPDVALMAFNDDQHAEAFKVLFSSCPELEAVLAEKPLTEHLFEAKEIEPELRKRYLSMNTVINFSPVFNRLESFLEGLGEAPREIDVGAESGLLRNDRLTAFISLSMQDFLTSEKERSPVLKRLLSDLTAALQVQEIVEQVDKGNPKLSIIEEPASEAKLTMPRFSSISEEKPEVVLGRIKDLSGLRSPSLCIKPVQQRNSQY